jgi:hypothetical protein
MTVISRQQQQDWASSYSDDSGQWLQMEQEAAAPNAVNLAREALAAADDALEGGNTLAIPEPTVDSAAPAVPAAPAAPAAAEAALAPDEASVAAADAADEPDPTQVPAFIASVWSACLADSPYRFFQQMVEFGWTVAQVASATGQTEQAFGDHLTRLGVPAGHGGASVLGRDAVNQPFLDALNAEIHRDPPPQPDASRPAWTVVNSVVDESGETYHQMGFDLAAFTADYLAQGTPEAQAFARIHGSMAVAPGEGVRFASGALITAPDGVDEAGRPTRIEMVWPLDQRVTQYVGFPTTNELDRMTVSEMAHTPTNEELIAVFGTGSAALPENAMSERMRAMYGTELATDLYRLTLASEALRKRYLTALSEGSQPPVWDGLSDPASTLKPGWSFESITDESGSAYVRYQFDPSAFHNWYVAQAAPENRLLGEIFGRAERPALDAAGSYATSGAPDSLQITVGYDELGRMNVVRDTTLDAQALGVIDLADPRELHQPNMVAYVPMFGFVSAAENFQTEVTFVDQALPIVVMAIAAWYGGVLGGEASAALGLTEAAGASAAGVAAGQVVSAVVAGTFQGVMNGIVSGNVDLGAIAHNLLAQQIPGITDMIIGPAGQVSSVWGAVAYAGTAGLVGVVAGGSFQDGVNTGFAHIFNTQVADALKAAKLTADAASMVDQVIGSAVTGASTAAVAGLLGGSVDVGVIFKSALTSVLTGPLPANVAKYLETLLPGSAGAILGSMAAQGLKELAAGGSFSDGVRKGAIEGVAAALDNALKIQIKAMLADPNASASDVATARYFGSAMVAALKIAAGGPQRKGYDLARAFLDKAFDLTKPMGEPAAPPAAPAAAPAAPTPEPAPAPAPVPEAAGVAPGSQALASSAWMAA